MNLLIFYSGMELASKFPIKTDNIGDCREKLFPNFRRIVVSLLHSIIAGTRLNAGPIAPDGFFRWPGPEDRSSTPCLCSSRLRAAGNLLRPGRDQRRYRSCGSPLRGGCFSTFPMAPAIPLTRPSKIASSGYRPVAYLSAIFAGLQHACNLAFLASVPGSPFD